jgi:hypothetical protein
MTSFFLGGKVSTTISTSILSPYIVGLLGWSRANSAEDTVFTNHHGALRVYRVIHGDTFTILGAVGSDIAIYKGLFGFAEIRASSGLNTDIYDLLIMWRAGIGFNFY